MLKDAPTNATAYAKTLAKGLKLLEVLAESAEGASAADLAGEIGVHKNSVYRYLNAFLASGYIQVADDGRYYLGNKILELGSQRLRRMPLRETAHPFLVQLSAGTQKTVHMSILDRLDVIYIDKIESPRTLPIMSRIGSRAPAYCTGVGKALLSALTAEQLVVLLRETALEERTPTTITDPIRLMEELRISAERGYAVDNGEHEVGIRCYGVPIRGFGGDVVGAISITALEREFECPEERTRMLSAVMAAATEISRALGAAGPALRSGPSAHDTD